MRLLNILIPATVTVFLTALAVLSAFWLTGLVPPGEWSQLIKAAILVFIVGSTLVVVAWSAYFSYIVRGAIEKLISR